MNLLKRLYRLGAVSLLSVFVFTGCSSTLSLVADRHINNNVRLPVDLIMVRNDAEVIDIGPDSWFGDPKRETLTIEDELIRLSFSGGEKMKYKLTMGSGVDKLIIFADYINQDERDKQQIVIPRSRWGFSHTVQLRKNGLELKE